MKTKTKPPQFPTTHTLITENQITTAIKMNKKKEDISKTVQPQPHH